jgi:predicted Zn-dependent protease
MRIPAFSGRGSGGLGSLGGRLPIILLIVAGVAVYWFSNQQEGLVGGRKQMITMSVSDEIRLGKESYLQLLRSEPILCGRGSGSCSPDASEVVKVINQVGQRIAKAAEDWEQDGAPMTVLGETTGKLPSWGSLSDKFDWQFNVIQSDVPNAFALPGGYVAFYTGILPTADNVDGIAVIMGHEVGHALARHGAERMSQQQAMQFGQLAVGMAVGDQDIGTQRMVMGAFGAAGQYGVLLPFSRQNESEADMIGLELVVRACFDPREAPKLWQRMGKLSDGKVPPEFASTHPNPETRMKAFEEVMPRAVAEYEKRCKQ